MEIRTKEDFGLAKPKFNMLLKALDAISAIRNTASHMSSAEAWAKCVNQVKSRTNHSLSKEIGESMRQLTLPMLYSYYLADKLNASLPQLPEQQASDRLLKCYQDIFAVVATCQNEQDYQGLEEKLRAYLQTTFPTLAKTYQLDKVALKKIRDSYWSLKEFILPEVAGIKVRDNFTRVWNQEVEDTADIAGIREFHDPRMAVFILEHIGKKLKSEAMKSWPSLGKMQNNVVKYGLLFRESEYAGFEIGSRTTFATILNIPRSELVAVYLAEKLGERIVPDLKAKGVNDDEIRAKIQGLYKQFREYVETNKTLNSKNLVDGCIKILKDLKSKYDFSNLDMFNWSHGLLDILNPYDHYKAQLRTASTNKPKIGILSDSVGAGLGIPDAWSDSRWTEVFPHLLLEGYEIDCEAVGISIPGFTTSDGLKMVTRSRTKEGIERQDSILDYHHSFDMVLIALGGNDIYGHDCTDELAEKIKQNIIKIVNKCKERGIKQIMWGMGVPETFNDFIKWRKKLNDVMQEIRKETGITVAMLSDDALSKNNMNKEYLPPEQNDELHPNVQGHNVIVRQTAAVVAAPLRRLIAEREALEEERRAAERQAKAKSNHPGDLPDDPWSQFNFEAYREQAWQQAVEDPRFGIGFINYAKYLNMKPALAFSETARGLSTATTVPDAAKKKPLTKGGTLSREQIREQIARLIGNVSDSTHASDPGEGVMRKSDDNKRKPDDNKGLNSGIRLK